MQDKNKIFITYNLTHSYSKTGVLFGLSRQRIHQIVKKYRTMDRQKNKLIRKAFINCFYCKEKNYEIHHIDGSTNNNNPDNTIPLCVKHHKLIHKSKNCVNCGKEEIYALGLCSCCYKLDWKNRENSKILLKNIYHKKYQREKLLKKEKTKEQRLKKLEHDRLYAKSYYLNHKKEKYLKKNRLKERDYWRRWYAKKKRSIVSHKISMGLIYRPKKRLFI